MLQGSSACGSSRMVKARGRLSRTIGSSCQIRVRPELDGLVVQTPVRQG